MSDDVLVDRIRGGDCDALARYIELHRPQLLAYIDRQLGSQLRSKVEPEDLLQEVSGEACRVLGQVDLAEREPFGWLCQVAKRRIVDAFRRHFGARKRAGAREVSINAGAKSDSEGDLINLLTASMTTASQVFSRNAKEAQLNEALEFLPEDQRECLKLRYGQGLASKDIAAKMGKSDGSVRVMLTRALNTLRERLRPPEDVDAPA